MRVHVTARDELSAGETALERLDAIRAIWNLFFNRGMRRISLGAWNAPHNSLLLGRLHTLHHPNGKPVGDMYWWEPFRVKDPSPKDVTADYQELKKFETLFRHGLRSAPFKAALLDVLVRYVRALDEHDPASAFLKLCRRQWSGGDDGDRVGGSLSL